MGPCINGASREKQQQRHRRLSRSAMLVEVAVAIACVLFRAPLLFVGGCARRQPLLLAGSRQLVPMPQVPLQAGPASAAISLGVAVAQSIIQSGAYETLKDAFARAREVKLASFSREDIATHVRRLANELATSDRHISDLAPELPDLVVQGTKFQQLMSSVLDSRELIGTVAVYGEPGVGKSVASALAVTSRNVPEGKREMTVLLHGNFETCMSHFFRTAHVGIVPVLARKLFRELRKRRKIRMQLIWDNMFSEGVSENRKEMVMELTRGALDYGHCIVVVTQTKEAALQVAGLDGDRTGIVPQQVQLVETTDNEAEQLSDKGDELQKALVNATAYRWSREEAATFILYARLQWLAETRQAEEEAEEEDESEADVIDWLFKSLDIRERSNDADQEALGRIDSEVLNSMSEAELSRLLRKAEKTDQTGLWTPVALKRLQIAEEGLE